MKEEWFVKNEVRFIDGLGTFADGKHKQTRAQLLRGYLRGLSRRTLGFSGIQLDVIRQHAEDALLREDGRRAA